MKKTLLLSFALVLSSTAGYAQDDDMYFVPKKKNVEQRQAFRSSYTYYSGSDRDVDEYNRRGLGSSYEVIAGDSAMKDVIDFSAEKGVYPDSTGDYSLTRRMARWDGYTPTDAYWQGYDQGRSDEWAANTWRSPWYYSWYDPWYYDRWYYDPWYYDPWYYDPWYYRHRPYGWYYGGYYRPYRTYVYAGGGYRYTGGKTYGGTRNHSYVSSGRSNWGQSGRSTSGSRRLSVPSRGSTNYSGASSRSSGSSWGIGNSRSSAPTRSSGSTYSSGGSRGGGFSGGSRGGGSMGGGRSGGRR